MQPLVIKLGGALLNSEANMAQFFATLTQKHSLNQRQIVIVHGGGTIIDELMNKLNYPVVRRQGLRVTPSEQIDIIVGALAGTANKLLLAAAKKYQMPAIGLCLSDGDMILVEQQDESLGHVGHPYAGDVKLLNLVLQQNYLPIICSIGITKEGMLMNVNADHAAIALAQLMSADLIFLSETVGVLDGKGNCLSQLNAAQAAEMIKQKIITDGMAVKVNAALDAAKMLNRSVEIASWQSNRLAELLEGTSIGTRISP